MTIRQLLNHTSGIPDFGMADGFGEQLAANRDRRWTPAEVVALVADKEPAFPPGTDYGYSNTNYVLLGEVIETVTGHGWAQEIRRRILDPLKLRDTYVAGFEPVRRPVIPGYFDLDRRRRGRQRRDRRALDVPGNLGRSGGLHRVHGAGPAGVR